MDDWIRFWTWVLYGGSALFGVLSLWVIVAGFADIKKMLAELRRQAQEETAGPSPRDPERD